MRTFSRLAVLGLLVAVACLAMLRPGPASAKPSAPSSPGASASSPAGNSGGATTPSTAQNLTFGIGPALPVPTTQVVDGRPYLSYLSSPGGTIRDAVALLNLSDKPITLHVYASDGLDTSEGSFTLTAAGEKLKDAGSWFKVAVPKSGVVTVPARQGNTYGRVEVPVEANIPANATPGDHVAGIVASLQTIGKDSKGTKLRFDQRIGVRAYIRLSGPITPKLTITHLHASHHTGFNLFGLLGRGTTKVSYDVNNKGNVRMSASQLVNASGWFTKPRVSRPSDLNDILPGSTIHVVRTIPHRWAFGKQHSLVTLFPVPVDPTVARTKPSIQDATVFWVIPWLILILLVVILLLLLLVWLFRRWRRHQQRLRAEGRSDNGGGQRKNKSGPISDTPQPVARIAVPAVLAALMSLSPGAARADVGSPDGGKVMIEANQATGLRTNSRTEGVWGHEGGHHTAGTYVAADLTDGAGKVTDASQALWLARFGVKDFNNLGIAFVKATKDGSAERPAVHAGENAGQAFAWFTSAGLATGLTGSAVPAQDAVLVVHTLAEYEDWINSGKPDQVLDSKLVEHDALQPGTPVSAHPQGKSIQNRWPSGEDISLVVFKYDGFTADGIPLVADDGTGHALTAWLTFKTVAGADNPALRTSAGYHVLSASPLPISPAAAEKVVAAGSTTAAGAKSGASGGSGPTGGSSRSSASSSTSPSTGESARATDAPSGGTSNDRSATVSAPAHHRSSHAGRDIGLGLLVLLALGAGGFVVARKRVT